MDGLGDVALQGTGIVGAFGGGEESPAEALAAEPSGVELGEAVAGVLGEVDRALEVVGV